MPLTKGFKNIEAIGSMRLVSMEIILSFTWQHIIMNYAMQ